MQALDLFDTALWSLRRARLRSALTMLGIVIGVAAVVGVVSLGQGAIGGIESDIAAMGINLVTVLPGSKIQAGFRLGSGSVATLIPEDAEAIQTECPSVELVSPTVKSQVQVVYERNNCSTTLEGGSVQYLDIRAWGLALGRFFDSSEERHLAKVCVLGETVRRSLFGRDNPCGRTIRVKHIPMLVIGVLRGKGQTSTGQDQDDLIVVPWTTGMRRVMGRASLNQILVSARDAERVNQASDEIEALLRRRHQIGPNDEQDFTCETQREVAEAQETATVLMMTLVSVIAVIALIVGGVGVMNIMLVSVLERTREIGIRMAIGARSRELTWQFLVETVVLTSLGGLAGVALGMSVALLLPVTLGWPTRITMAPALIALLSSAAVGVAFGIYPAYQASLKDPIEALRYE